jgi:hypothetical protein
MSYSSPLEVVQAQLDAYNSKDMEALAGHLLAKCGAVRKPVQCKIKNLANERIPRRYSVHQPKELALARKRMKEWKDVDA